MRIPVLGLLLLGLLTAVAPALAAEAIIGSVKLCSGAAVVLRGQQVLPAQPGLQLESRDILRTGADGTLGVILRDDTRISLGPESEVVLAEFLFAPAQGELSLVVRMVRGIVQFISGEISKLAPERVKFETPVGVVGVRGTRFLVKIDGEAAP